MVENERKTRKVTKRYPKKKTGGAYRRRNSTNLWIFGAGINYGEELIIHPGLATPTRM